MSSQTPGQIIYAILTTPGTSGVARVLGNRCYPGQAPSPVETPFKPFAVYRQIMSEHLCTSVGPDSLQTVRYAIACWAENNDDADDLRSKIIAALNGYSDEYIGISIRGIFIDGVVDNNEMPFSAEELGAFGRVVTCSVWYQIF